jgi:hypothetical protein
MIENFLRRPATAIEWAADAVRVLAVLGVVVAAFGWGVTALGITALTLPALVLPRVLGVIAWFDLLYSVTVIVAAWSNVLDLYRGIAGWDLLVHFAATGVLAGMLFVLLERTRVVAPGSTHPAAGRRRVPLVIVTALGLAIASVWEMFEWLAKNYVSDEVYVTYDDTIGDMVFGGAGALVMAGVLLVVRVDRD